MGDKPSFDDLYRSHYSRLVVLARLMTGAMAPAEEVVQDAFVQLYRKWSSIEYPTTYVRIAVVNGCRSHGRRQALERRSRMPDRDMTGEQFIDAARAGTLPDHPMVAHLCLLAGEGAC